ncbi:mechanosensitive ion channel family protein [Patescibacteria group bacterium]|nr:mechanosensitive ion channel family protein [Patescibacteria group bacterium]
MQNLQSDVLTGFNGVTVSATQILPKIPAAVVALLLGFIIIKIVSRFLKASLRLTHWPVGLQEIMATLLRIVMWGLLLIAVLQILGLSSVALAVTGSFAILLLGFSSGISSTVSDLMAGLQLANDKDFRVGYKVKVGDNKTVGVIREMDIKKTRILGEDGQLHVVPNSVIEKNEWVVIERHVFSQMPKAQSAIINKASTIKSKVSSIKKKG